MTAGLFALWSTPGSSTPKSLDS